MNRMLVFLTCITWGGATISSATPAGAVLYNQSSGHYASCSSSYNAAEDPCGNSAYRQTIKIISGACNSGGCSATDDSYVQFVYPPGRQSATLADIYCNGYFAYNLSACQC
jgi:hypothetical protein